MVISDGTASSPEERLENARREAQTQIASGLIQGAVIAVAGGPAAAAGLQCVHPAEKPMTVHSRFDIASVGKVFTAACCALLAADGELEPDAPFTRYLPEHVLGKSCNITVRDLAMHAGGFDNSKPYDSDDVEIFNRELFGKRPVRPRLEAFEYACSNFILLGKIAERISGTDLDTLARERIWKPLGMDRTQSNTGSRTVPPAGTTTVPVICVRSRSGAAAVFQPRGICFYSRGIFSSAAAFPARIMT